MRFVEGKISVRIQQRPSNSIPTSLKFDSGLLDYVYFETEPMLEAKKGDLLDFSKAKKLEKPEPIEMIKLSPKQIAKGKEIIERLKTKYKKGLEAQAGAPEPIYDEVYQKGAKLLDEEDLQGDLSGKAEILVD